MVLDRTERQKLGVRKWISSGCRGSFCWSTGVGKTYASMIAIKVFLSKNKDKVITVVVPTEYLKLQWIQELSKNQLLGAVSVEIINSAVKRNDQIDFLIIDECHRIPSDTFYSVFEKRQPKIVLGLSATFDRLDGKQEMLKQYCPVCDTITIQEAIKNKWLSPYKEYKVLISPDDIDEYREVNKQFQESFSVFDFNFQLAMSCLTNIVSRRTYGKRIGMSAKDLDAVVFTWNRCLKARKSYVMNHPKKLEIARKIIAARPGKKIITFSSTISQSEKIGGGFLINSGKTKKKNRITFEEFNQMKSGVIHTARSLDEGADIKDLSIAIILSNTSSATQKTQRVG